MVSRRYLQERLSEALRENSRLCSDLEYERKYSALKSDTIEGYRCQLTLRDQLVSKNQQARHELEDQVKELEAQVLVLTGQVEVLSSAVRTTAKAGA